MVPRILIALQGGVCCVFVFFSSHFGCFLCASHCPEELYTQQFLSPHDNPMRYAVFLSPFVDRKTDSVSLNHLPKVRQLVSPRLRIHTEVRADSSLLSPGALLALEGGTNLGVKTWVQIQVPLVTTAWELPFPESPLLPPVTLSPPCYLGKIRFKQATQDCADGERTSRKGHLNGAPRKGSEQ